MKLEILMLVFKINSNTTLVKVKYIRQASGLAGEEYSNTTLVKVKLDFTLRKLEKSEYSNTTLVKVKC